MEIYPTQVPVIKTGPIDSFHNVITFIELVSMNVHVRVIIPGIIKRDNWISFWRKKERVAMKLFIMYRWNYLKLMTYTVAYERHFLKRMGDAPNKMIVKTSNKEYFGTNA